MKRIMIVAVHDDGNFVTVSREVGKVSGVSMVAEADADNPEARIAYLRARADLEERLWDALRNPK